MVDGICGLIAVLILVGLCVFLCWYDNYTNKDKRRLENEKNKAIIELSKCICKIYNNDEEENNND